MKTIRLFLTGVILYICAACSTDVDFGEQYKKQIYIVNANERIVSAEHNLTESTDGFMTFYCAGSETSQKDVVVRYKIDKEALDAYNKSEYDENTAKYMECVPEDKIRFHENTVTIKAGEDYAILGFSINTLDLDPSKNYAIPVTITEVSAYEINPEMKTLFYNLKLKTPYSGLYDSRLELHRFALLQSTRFAQKKTIATAKNEIRVPILDKKEIPDGSIDYYVITLNEEDNTVTVTSEAEGFTPLKVMNVKPSPDSPAPQQVPVNYYKPETKEFVIGYSYPVNGTLHFIIETMKHIE